MIVGVVKEIKDNENRVALTPQGAQLLTAAGHQVRIQQGAGNGAGFPDNAYEEAGAVVTQIHAAWQSDLVIKVKEPQPEEYDFLQGQILFTYLHLSGVPTSLTRALLQSATSAIAYETVEDKDGRLPLLAPMSAVAGNMAITVGSYYLAGNNGGRGVQLGRVLGEKNGRVLIIGDGVVGRHAAAVASAMGATVLMFGRNPERLGRLKEEIGPELVYIFSTPEGIAAELPECDLLVGAVLRPGARAPYVVSEEMVKAMPRGSVIVDVSIDQGGCVATSRPTSHSHPVFEKHGVIHYCVTNMPGAYPRTATVALTEVTLPYILWLADNGMEAIVSREGLNRGVNTHKGCITYRKVAEDLGMTERYRPLAEL
jgi:alanine dehydrogenase